MKYFRRVIQITAEHSPNVRLARAQQRAGMEVTHEVLVPGVLTWAQFQHRLATWDEQRKCVGLYGRFYVGAELMLYPPDWLARANRRHQEVRHKQRRALAVGCDPAEGGDRTSMAAVDEWGLLDLVSKPTPDTGAIQGELLGFMARHGVAPERVCIDRGGGGKHIADAIYRDTGMEIRTVAFGSKPALEPKRGLRMLEEKLEVLEEAYTYLDRRAQMFWELSHHMDPEGDSAKSSRETFAIPHADQGESYARLAHQLSKIPKTWDKVGRIRLLPKNNPLDPDDPRTLVKLIGYSPDEADAVVLAVHARDHEKRVSTAGGF